VHQNARALRSASSAVQQYICPVCLHANGSPSELGTVPPVGFYRPRCYRPALQELEMLVESAATVLPVTGLRAHESLSYVCKVATDWRARYVYS
jgi:hypothetical protein